MAKHPFPCPSCGLGSIDNGFQEVDPVWKISRTSGIAQCLDCGFITDEEIVKKKSEPSYPSYCFDHKWIQTGMKVSWCSKCDAEGVYSFENGRYEKR
jgi:hypothetical protein